MLHDIKKYTSKRFHICDNCYTPSPLTIAFQWRSHEEICFKKKKPSIPNCNGTFAKSKRAIREIEDYSRTAKSFVGIERYQTEGNRITQIREATIIRQLMLDYE